MWKQARLIACVFHTLVWIALGAMCIRDRQYLQALMALVIVTWGIVFNVLLPWSGSGQATRPRGAAGKK